MLIGAYSSLQWWVYRKNAKMLLTADRWLSSVGLIPVANPFTLHIWFIAYIKISVGATLSGGFVECILPQFPICLFVSIQVCACFCFHRTCEPRCLSLSLSLRLPAVTWLMRKQMALWDEFQSVTSHWASAALSSHWHGLSLNQGLGGCHFTPAHCHSARKHWCWWSWC